MSDVSACEPGEDVTVRAWVCVGNARLAAIVDYGVHGIAPFGPHGGDLFVPDPAATEIVHVRREQHEDYRWNVSDPHTPGVQREVWSTRDLAPQHQEPDRVVWCAYDGGEDEFPNEVFEFDDLDLALAWLRAHPPGEWVETCADAGTRTARTRTWAP